MTPPSLPAVIPASSGSERMARAVLSVVAHTPTSACTVAAQPLQAAQAATRVAARQAAVAAAGLALPPGPLGWLTILPEMMAVWRIQSQLVADIAALYGRSAELTQSHMLYCLFRHTAAQALRDLGVRVGERLVLRPAAVAVLQKAAQAIGVKLSERVLSRTVSRWLPLVGAAGVGAYAYYDTREVAKAAIALFQGDDTAELPAP